MKKKNEFDYYAQFEKAAALAEKAVKELKKYIEEFNSETTEDEKNRIHEIENKADGILHETKTYLLKDFLPPIDREDIVAISHRIDDLVDAIDEFVINIDIFVITEIKQNMKAGITLLERCVELVHQLVIVMKNLKASEEIKAKVVEVNQIEEQADKLYENSVRELYKIETDAIQLIKYSNMYAGIENCFDACENIAECVEEVLLKNA